MSKLDDALREALRRQDPPEGFAARLMQRLPSRDREGAVVRTMAPPRWSFRLRWAVALAAAIVLLVAGAEYRRQRLQRVAEERARDQVMLALRITGSKLRMVQERIHWVARAPLER